MFGEALEDVFRYARIVENLVVPSPGPYSSSSPAEKQAWLVRRLQMASSGRGGAWVSLAVDPVPALREQIARAAQRVAPDYPVDESLVAPMQLRRELVSAVQAGAKGIWLRTTRPLQAQRSADNLRGSVVRWTTRDLTLWGPWIMAGNPVPPPSVDSPYWTGAAWALENSQLAVFQPSAPSEWLGATAPEQRKLVFSWAAASPNRHVLRLSLATVQRVEASWDRGQVRWEVELPAPVETFVITSDDRVLRFIEQHLRETAAESAADMLESAAVDLSMAARLVAAQSSIESNGAPERTGPESQRPVAGIASETGRAVREIQTIEMLLDRARADLRNGAVADAMRRGLAADDRARTILYQAYRRALDALPSPSSSPFVVQPTALELHWRMADACRRSQWRSVRLPGAEFSDLSTMLQTGWEQQRRLQEEVESRVELVPASENAGQLRLAAYAHGPAPNQIPGGYEGASVRVRSAPISLKAGQFVRVRATARILQMGDAPGSGLLVYDNQLGPGFGQLVQGPPGTTVPIDLYRMVVDDGEFRVLSECRGHCDVLLEALRVDAIEPAANRANYPTDPLGP